MVKFKDFAQKIIKSPTWIRKGTIEDVNDTLIRMNIWIEEKQIKPISIETIMLPYDHNFDNGEAYRISFSDGSSIVPVPHFRVWYHDHSHL